MNISIFRNLNKFKEICYFNKFINLPPRDFQISAKHGKKITNLRCALSQWDFFEILQTLITLKLY